MKNKRLLKRRSMGWLVAVCMLLAMMGSIIGASAAEGYTLTLVTENETYPGNYACGTIELEIGGNAASTYAPDGDGEVYSDEVEIGSAVLITAEVAEGYTLSWQVLAKDRSIELSDYIEAMGNSLSVVMPDTNLTIFAVFEKFNAGGSGGGESAPPVTYELDYPEWVEILAGSTYPQASRSIEELAALLGIELVGSDGSTVSYEITSADYREDLLTADGIYTVNFTVTYGGKDYKGTIEIEFTDDLPPVIDAPDAIELYLENASDAPKTLEELVAALKVTGLDNCDGAVEVSCEVYGMAFEDIDWTVDGEYVLAFFVKDAASNAVERIVTLYVEVAWPAGDETPGDETPGDETPDDETPGGETPGGGSNDDNPGGGGHTGGDDRWTEEVWENIPETAILVPLDDGRWDVQSPQGEPIGIVVEQEGEWAFIGTDDVPAGNFTSLPNTGSRTVHFVTLLGLALIGAGALLRKRPDLGK